MVYKGTVVHTMNGENVLEYHLWTDDWKNMVANSKFKDYEHFMNPAPEGYIVLQDHGDQLEHRAYNSEPVHDGLATLRVYTPIPPRIA